MIYKNNISNQTFLSKIDLINVEHTSGSMMPQDVMIKIPSLDDYVFKRYDVTFETAIQKFFVGLQNRFKKINLWYSGGLDSQLLLNYCMKFDIPLDEITTCIKLPFGNTVQSQFSAEELITAIPYLSTIKSYTDRHNIKINNPVVTEKEYEKFFNDPDWIKNINIGSVRDPCMIANIIDLLDLAQGHDYCNLHGAITPFVYYDRVWKFYFVDRQLLPETQGPIYIPTLHDLDFLEAYVNIIASELENIDQYKKKFSLSTVRSSVSSRFFLQQIPQVRQVNSTIWEHYPKTNFRIAESHSTIIEKINCASFKSYIDYRSAMDLRPAWFHAYETNTDWAVIEQAFNFGGVCTKSYALV